MTNERNLYYRELERRLECPRARRREFLAETRRAAEHFLKENPEAVFSDVRRFLGQPEELARAYNETLGAEVTEKFRRGRRLKKVLLLAAAVVVVVASVAGVVYLNHLHYNVHITSETTTVIYETEREKTE